MGATGSSFANPPGAYVRLAPGMSSTNNPSYYLPIGNYPSLPANLTDSISSITLAPFTRMVVADLAGNMVAFSNPRPTSVHLVDLGSWDSVIVRCRITVATQ
jgi:hypothetical protein